VFTDLSNPYSLSFFQVKSPVPAFDMPKARGNQGDDNSNEESEQITSMNEKIAEMAAAQEEMQTNFENLSGQLIALAKQSEETNVHVAESNTVQARIYEQLARINERAEIEAKKREAGKSTSWDDEASDEGSESSTRHSGYDLATLEKAMASLATKQMNFTAREWVQHVLGQITWDYNVAAKDEKIQQGSTLAQIMKKTGHISYVKWFQQLGMILTTMGLETTYNLWDFSRGMINPELGIDMDSIDASTFEVKIHEVLSSDWKVAFERKVDPTFRRNETITMETLVKTFDRCLYNTVIKLIDQGYWSSIRQRDDMRDSTSGFRVLHILWQLEGSKQTEVEFWNSATQELSSKPKPEEQSDVNFYAEVVRTAQSLFENGADPNGVTAAVKSACTYNKERGNTVSESSAMAIQTHFMEYKSRRKKKNQIGYPWDTDITETIKSILGVTSQADSKGAPHLHSKVEDKAGGTGNSAKTGRKPPLCKKCNSAHYIWDCPAVKEHMCSNCGQKGHMESYKKCPRYVRDVGSNPAGTAAQAAAPLATTQITPTQIQEIAAAVAAAFREPLGKKN
jgi:hypothetical protein